MTGEKLGVVARFAVKHDSIEAFKELAMRPMVEPTQGEPGCIRYELWQGEAEPGRFAMVEEWESGEALAKHLSLESLQSAVRELVPMGAEPIAMQRFRKVS